MDFDNAIEIEGRYFVDLLTGQVAKNMIQAFFFDMQQVSGDRGRPEGIDPLPGEEGRGPRRRHDGRRDRLRLREGRHRGRAQGRLDRGRRARQGVLRGPAREGGRPRALDPGEGATSCSPASPRPTTPGGGGCRPRDRGGVRGPRGEGPGVRGDRAAPRCPMRCSGRTPRRCRSPTWPRACRGRRTSSGCTSSPRWTRCRCWRSSRASRRATRRSTARSTSPSRSRRRRSSSTTAAASSRAGVIGTFIDEGVAMLARGRAGGLHRAGVEPGGLPGAGRCS